MTVRHLIFDWSGTLSDDLTPVYEACMQVMQQLLGRRISLEEFRREFTLPYMNFWHKYVPELTKDQCVKLYTRAFEQVSAPTIYEGVADTLDTLYSRGYHMIIISAHLQDKLDEEAASYGVRDFFLEINGSIYDKVQMIVDIMQRNGFDAVSTVYVGDMTHDVDAGRRAGVGTVAIDWGYQSREQLREAEPDQVISDIAELPQLLLP